MKYNYHACRDMVYVPFSNMYDEVYKQTLKEIFYGQNIYLHTTRRRTIYGIKNSNAEYPTKGGEAMSFLNWIQNITFEDSAFLEACEIGPTGNIHMIFNQKYEQTVQKLLGQDLKKLARENFDENIIVKIFSDERVQMETGTVRSEEHVYDLGNE